MKGKVFDNESDVRDNQSHKMTSNKFDYDLYKEEKNVVEKLVQVKRVKSPSKGEKWRILENNKIIFCLEGNKVSKKEKEFLRTPDGFNFLIAEFKQGIKSLNQLKIKLKEKLSNG